MKCLLSFCFLYIGAIHSLSAQPVSPGTDSLRHTTIVTGRENPNAIPLHFITVELLIGIYGRDRPGLPSVDLFVDQYDVDWSIAEKMVDAIRDTAQRIQEVTLAERQAFCARSFSSKDSWAAAAIALDADARGLRVVEFNRLRGLAGPELWEKIVLTGSQAAQGAAIVSENYDSRATEVGYEAVFANQCGNSSIKE